MKAPTFVHPYMSYFMYVIPPKILGYQFYLRGVKHSGGTWPVIGDWVMLPENIYRRPINGFKGEA
jgi:hypothetical protein